MIKKILKIVEKFLKKKIKPVPVPPVAEPSLVYVIKQYMIDNDIPIPEIMMLGIRDESGIEQDVINDYLGYWTEDEIFLCPGTTDPSVYYTLNKKDRNKKGTFHMSKGYHKNIWCIGRHKGYEALVNDEKKCLPTTGWRDANYNFKFDEGDLIVKGHFGINFHRMHPVNLVDKIGKYSSGCQVVRNPEDFKKILEKVKSYGKDIVVSYILFDISEIPGELLQS